VHRSNCWKLNWTVQQLEETKSWSLGKTKTPGLPNTISIDDCLSFPMVHFTTPNGLRLMSSGHQSLVELLNLGKYGPTWHSGINQDSDEISSWPPQKLCIWKTPLMNTTFRWLLIRPILIHGLVATDFWIQVIVLNCFGQIRHWNKIPALGAQNEWILMRLDYGSGN
jgi:hypothetical protein